MITQCLTVRQPWASLIFAQYPKTIENRVWPTGLRERIGIHAGLAVDRAAVTAMPEAPTSDRGVILGTVEITGCHLAGSQQCQWHRCDSNPWAMWPDNSHPVIYHWELEHPREFVTPIRASGAQKFWAPLPTTQYLIATAEFVL